MAVPRRQQLDPGFNTRDIRPWGVRADETMSTPEVATGIFAIAGGSLLFIPGVGWLAELVALFAALYAWYLFGKGTRLPLRLPSFAACKDPNNKKPGGGVGQAEGILYVGNTRPENEELWLTNSDARTHILYLGTTGAGKTEGLKSLVSNALCWGSGFIYIDGKADTDLWAALFALARRFGREDDLLVLNYMTGNSDDGAPSNSLNPFSSGSASYLTNLMVGLMDEAGGDNAMWKGRAISLMSSLMPALTYKREHFGVLLDVGYVRDQLTLQAVVRLSRDVDLPDRITRGIKSYLETLPGYLDEAFDDDGRERPPAPDEAPFDISICLQQHGYLSMQFTRAMQSLADEYGYIFQTQIADIDMLDVVLNRRILVTLIPALEKSADEAANLGKIVAAAIKGMMGSTLGANIEGDWEGIIENKQTRASSPFITVFDEVGYYTAQGMAVMAAQARSLGFSLVFSAQDLPAMEKRVREEARSITANCNLKLFGKLEDSQDTQEFFKKTVGTAFVALGGGFSTQPGSSSMTYHDTLSATFQGVDKAMFGDLKRQTEGEVHLCWGSAVLEANMFYANPEKVKAIRVQKFLKVSPLDLVVPPQDVEIDEVLHRLRDKHWTAAGAAAAGDPSDALAAMLDGFRLGRSVEGQPQAPAALAVAAIADLTREAEDREEARRLLIAPDEPEEAPPAEEPEPATAPQVAAPQPPVDPQPVADAPLEDAPLAAAPPADAPAIPPVSAADDVVEALDRPMVSGKAPPDAISAEIHDLLRHAARVMSAELAAHRPLHPDQPPPVDQHREAAE